MVEHEYISWNSIDFDALRKHIDPKRKEAEKIIRDKARTPSKRALRQRLDYQDVQWIMDPLEIDIPEPGDSFYAGNIEGYSLRVTTEMGSNGTGLLINAYKEPWAIEPDLKAVEDVVAAISQETNLCFNPDRVAYSEEYPQKIDFPLLMSKEEILVFTKTS